MKPKKTSSETPTHCEACKSNTEALNTLCERFENSFTIWDKKQEKESDMRNSYLERVSHRIINRLDSINENLCIIKNRHCEVELNEENFPGITFYHPPKRNLFQRIRLSYYSLRKWIDRLKLSISKPANNNEPW